MFLDRLATAPVVQVRRLGLPRELRIAGELLPIRTVKVLSRLAGQVSEVRFEAGDMVPAGAVVAVVRSREFEERVALREQSVRAAEVELRARQREWSEAEQLLARRRELARRELIARREADDAEAALETARAAADLARAHLAQQQSMLAQAHAERALTQVIAPIGGEVTRREVEPGSPVIAGAAVLSLGDLARLKLVARVRRAGSAGLRHGAAARISTEVSAGRDFAGEISRLTQVEDGVSELEIVIDNRGRSLRSGTQVDAWIELGAPRDLLWVPRSAVITEQGLHYVYKMESGHAVRRPITIGPEWEEDIAVLQGLADGDFVVADRAISGTEDSGPKRRLPSRVKTEL